jgi:hypothetical protein
MVIKVPIIVSYNNKGTKQAVKGIGGLEKSFQKMGLASKLSFAAATTAVTGFTKKAVTAALEESKAVAVLNNQLKNLGLAFAATGVNTYIDNLQRATAVSEDLLRPAFASLIRATNDLGKAQQLLALSLDISAGTGKSLEAITMSLNRAYLGNTTALGRLGVGITKAELKTLSFEQIQERLTVLFAGSAKAAVDTYAGSMAKLQIAAAEASETIGFALINGIKRLGDEKGIDDAADSMQNFADQTSYAITGISVLADKLNSSFGGKALNYLLQFGPVAIAINELARLGKATVASEITATNRQSPRVAEQAAAKAAKARKVEIADRTKIVSLTKVQTANERLARTFDLDAIQLAAALQGKLSKEDEARVKALQALKTEDKNDDFKALQDLDAAKRQSTFDEIARLKMIVEESKKANEEILADARARIATLGKASVPSAVAYSVGAAGSTFAPGLAEAQTAIAAGTFGGMGDLSYLGFDLAALGAANMQMEAGIAAQQGTAGPTNLTVNLQGGINVGSTFEFYQTVQTALQELNRAGNSLTSAGS